MAQPNRIVYLITRADEIGGAQVHVRDLAVAMRNAGVQVTVLGGGTGELAEQLGRAGITFRQVHNLGREIHPVRDALAVREIVRILRELAPDLLALHSSKAGILGRLAAVRAGVPAVFTAHGWAFTGGVPGFKKRMFRAVERAAGLLATAVINVSAYDRDLARSAGLVPDDRLHVVRNGVPDVDTSLRASPRSDPPRLIMVARLAPPKDPLRLLRVLATIEAPWTLDLVGEGELRAELERFITDRGLSERVRLLGARDDVPELLARAQGFVLTSRWEGLPLTILEAMRAGLPVVAADVGGVGEAVAHGVTGFLAAAHGELRQGLARLVEDHELRERLGAAGRERYEREFTFAHQLAATRDVYARALEVGK